LLSGKPNHPVRIPLVFVVLSTALLLTACSTPAARIANHRSAFATFPASTREEIRQGRIEVGFTKEMVLMALGDPARQFVRRSDQGETDVWIYPRTGPRFSLGLGLGADAAGRGGVGGGLAVSAGPSDFEEKMRVEFVVGKVTLIEYARR
jgi:hypothetical protein